MKPFEEIELLNKLGEGAYGSVYQARIIKTGETVAVKSIKITADEEGVSSTTLREMTILQNLDHPNIVKYFSIYQTTEPKNRL
jgi:serine/threonine protein kinase